MSDYWATDISKTCFVQNKLQFDSLLIIIKYGLLCVSHRNILFIIEWNSQSVHYQ